jgi:hypothetical protein
VFFSRYLNLWCGRAETPENGILVTQGDAVMYGTRYLQQVEGVRSDVTLIEADMVSGEW